jgi:PQQ-dependent dehydrogenase (methanol/ethanol family)
MMQRALSAILLVSAASLSIAQVKNFQPVTQKDLENPSPNDWLMYSRTFDAQRYSPLNQITRQNVNQLGLAWSRGMVAGAVETIPIVHNGVMYIAGPGATVLALDATNGDLLWEYKRPVTAAIAASARTKTIAIYGDVVGYTAPDSFVVGLDARTGERRWETKADARSHTSGPIAIDGKFISGGSCGGNLRANCFIAAHDALTGKEVWKFYTAAGDDDPGGKTWGGAPEANRTTSTWGLPGTYDPVRKMLYWGVANPTPNTRAARHQGNPEAISRTAPSDLYSNSTLALDPNTGKLAWYYQHLPGDDWDEDYTHERTLFRTRINPDPKFVKWINPDTKGQDHDVAVMVGEGGGVFVLDRGNGQFLWATPFPYDVPNFLISNIDVKTGKTEINWDLVFKKPGENHLICFFNTRSFWPTAYSPKTNSLYVPYIDSCLDMTSANGAQREKRGGKTRPGVDLDHLNAIAKINMSTGEILRFNVGRAPTNGAVLATAGDLIFHGDLNRRFRAFDADTGKELWQSILGGMVAVSTITYSVNGRQYVAVTTGDGLLAAGLMTQADLKPVRGHNAIYVFALPERK